MQHRNVFFRLLPNKTLRASVITYSPASEESCFDAELQSLVILFHVGVAGKSKGCQKGNPPLGSILPPKMTAGSTPVIVSVEIYSSATCPWNPVLSTSFVFSIHRDQYQPGDCQQRHDHFAFHQNDIILLAIRTCLIKLKSCILGKNPMHQSYYWGAHLKALLMHQGLASHQGVSGFRTEMNLKKKKRRCFYLKQINLEEDFSFHPGDIRRYNCPHKRQSSQCDFYERV